MNEKIQKQGIKLDQMAEWITQEAEKIYLEREKAYSEATLRELERYFFLQSIDHHWKEHLLALDHLKEGIHLRGYAQKDPLVEYRKEGFALFKLLDVAIRQSALSRLYTAKILSQSEREAQQKRVEEETLRKLEAMQLSGPNPDGDTAASGPVVNEVASRPSEAATPEAPNPALQAAMSFMKKYENDRMRQMQAATAGAGNSSTTANAPTAPVRSSEPKIGRNDPCFCGSGKKFKQCHGKES